MALQVIQLSCPTCGAAVSSDMKVCEYCDNPVVIADFSSVESMSPLQVNKYASSYRKTLAENPDNQEVNASIGFCYLKLKMYQEAYQAFSKAIVDNFDNADTYFYAAVCLLKGKKAFVTPRADIDKILELINAATMIEPKGIYYYFLAYIKQDFFARKFLRTSPTYQEALAMAKQSGLTAADAAQLFRILGVEKPAVL